VSICVKLMIHEQQRNQVHVTYNLILFVYDSKLLLLYIYIYTCIYIHTFIKFSQLDLTEMQ